MSDTLHGFTWGPITVERTASHNGYRVLTIQTPRGRLELIITPTGYFRGHGNLLPTRKGPI